MRTEANALGAPCTVCMFPPHLYDCRLSQAAGFWYAVICHILLHQRCEYGIILQYFFGN